ncbi:unannotated protein [freshwater metagenome]|uniref:Unannotated protein n=1 Tax=freshwater metagenome TaxID=449393 RepID=A0A6J7R351_9ZZZZ
MRNPGVSKSNDVSGRIDIPALAATRSPIRRTPSTSIGTFSSTLIASAASSTSNRSGLFEGGITNLSLAISSSLIDPRPRSFDPCGTRPTKRSSSKCSSMSFLFVTGAVTTACASWRSSTSATNLSEAPSCIRRITSGADRCIALTKSGTSHLLAVPTTPKEALPILSPNTSATSEAISLASCLIRLARASTARPASVRVAP